MVSILKKNIYFPGVVPFLLVALGVIILASLTNYSFTKQAARQLLDGIIVISGSDTMSSKELEVKRTIPPHSNYYAANLATVGVWAVIGLITQAILRLAYGIFVKPYTEDWKTLHFINANKKIVEKNRIAWLLAIFCSTTLLIVAMFVFRVFVSSYYRLALSTGSTDAIFYFFVSVILESLLVLCALFTIFISRRTY